MRLGAIFLNMAVRHSGHENIFVSYGAYNEQNYMKSEASQPYSRGPLGNWIRGAESSPKKPPA